MKCPFCAEEIQDAAILCRFCGAVKQDEQWYPPARTVAAAPRPKGAFTIKSAGVLFIISGLYVLISPTSEVPLFGAMRGGLLATGYNVGFAALFLGIGIGLIIGKPWGYGLVMSGTALYSVDKILLMLDKPAQEAYFAAGTSVQSLASFIGLQEADLQAVWSQAIILGCLISLACWWGFALYIRIRRDYFRRDISPPASRASSL